MWARSTKRSKAARISSSDRRLAFRIRSRCPSPNPIAIWPGRPVGQVWDPRSRGRSYDRRPSGHCRPRPLQSSASTDGTLMLAGIGLSLLSALVINAGNLIEKVAVDRLPGFSARRTTHMLRTLLSSKLWLVGVVVSVTGLAFQVVAFALAPIAVVQSIFCGGLVFLV